MKRESGSSARAGFTLIELLMVIAIIGFLSSIILVSMRTAKDSAHESAAYQEMKQIESALQLYLIENNDTYPADQNRDIPPGIEAYLSTGDWPNAPWPGSVYDWDNWDEDELSYTPKDNIVQLSVRFCEIGNPGSCQFPNEAWAQDFDVNSAAYWCFKGPCRSHSGEPENHPGYCMNCNE